MRLFIGTLLVLLIVANPVYGQLTEIRVDNSTMPGLDIEGVSIDQSGVLTITSKDGNYEIRETAVVNGDVVINSFRVNNNSSANLQVGATASISWGTSDADSCSASATPADSLAGWNTTTVIVTTDSRDVTFPDAGSYNLHLNCSGTNGSTDNASLTVQVGGASITNFTITPNTASRGDDVSLTFEWSSTNTDACYGSANWPGSTELASSGSDTVNITNIQSSAVYTLTCYGLFDEDSTTRSLIVTEPQLICNPSLTANLDYEWMDVFRDQWPGPRSQQVRLKIPTRGYIAIEFKVGDLEDTGLFTNIEASGTSGYRFGSVSRCAGEFMDVDDACSHKWGDSGGISWATNGSAGKCQLDKGETYYWNMTFTDGEEQTHQGVSEHSVKHILWSLTGISLSLNRTRLVKPV